MNLAIINRGIVKNIPQYLEAKGYDSKRVVKVLGRKDTELYSCYIPNRLTNDIFGYTLIGGLSYIQTELAKLSKATGVKFSVSVTTLQEDDGLTKEERMVITAAMLGIKNPDALKNANSKLKLESQQ